MDRLLYLSVEVTVYRWQILHIWSGSGSRRKFISACGKFAAVSHGISQTGPRKLEKNCRRKLWTLITTSSSRQTRPLDMLLLLWLGRPLQKSLKPGRFKSDQEKYKLQKDCSSSKYASFDRVSFSIWCHTFKTAAMTLYNGTMLIYENADNVST